MQHNILLIDDDEDEHIIFNSALQNLSSNFYCSLAKGWQEAKKILSFLIPDFIFLDYNMPVMNGIECLKEIKQNPELENVPVYLYSTGINDTECKKALTIGATDCIKKQVSVQELSKLLETVLNKQSL